MISVAQTHHTPAISILPSLNLLQDVSFYITTSSSINKLSISSTKSTFKLYLQKSQTNNWDIIKKKSKTIQNTQRRAAKLHAEANQPIEFPSIAPLLVSTSHLLPSQACSHSSSSSRTFSAPIIY